MAIIIKMRVSSEYVPVPYAEHLEQTTLPSVEKIHTAVRQLLYQEGS